MHESVRPSHPILSDSSQGEGVRGRTSSQSQAPAPMPAPGNGSKQPALQGQGNALLPAGLSLPSWELTSSSGNLAATASADGWMLEPQEAPFRWRLGLSQPASPTRTGLPGCLGGS